LGQAVDDVPALVLGGREEGADDRQVCRALQRTEAAGDFLTELHHAPVTLGLIVGEGNGWIVEEAQRVLLACCPAQEQVVSGAARRAAAPFGASLHQGARQRRLRLVKSEPFGENGVVTALETFDELGLQRNVPFSREIRRVTGAAQQPLRLARPVLILNFDKSLPFAKMMSVAQVHRACSTPCIV
jgi:hypothetical protein